MRLSGERVELRDIRNGDRSWSVIVVNPGGHQVAAFGSDPLSFPDRRSIIPRQNPSLQLSP
jgi:hypothetical protein